MAKLINGSGNPAVYANEDSDLIAALAGNTTAIAAVGSEYAATQEDANTIGLADGVIITKEGRRIQLDEGKTDLFTIPTGSAGTTSYYIIGYKLTTDAESKQTCETFVQKMSSSSETITEDTFKGGATDVYVSVYRVVQDGLNIDSINLLLPKLSNVGRLKSDLTANSHQFKAGYQNGKYGFTINNVFYEIGGGSMPILDFANPVKTFTSNTDTYTATGGEYLHIGCFAPATANTEALLNIDGNPFIKNVYASVNFGDNGVVLQKLGAGQVVSISNARMDISVIHILREK